MKLIKCFSLAFFMLSGYAYSESSLAVSKPSAVWMDAGVPNEFYILMPTAKWYKINRNTVGTVVFESYLAMATSAVANGKSLNGWVGVDCGASCNVTKLGGNTYGGELTQLIFWNY